MSYSCDRARSITWGIDGGLPSIPHGVWLNRGRDNERFLGAVFSDVPSLRATPSSVRRQAEADSGIRWSASRPRSSRTSSTATSPWSGHDMTTAS